MPGTALFGSAASRGQTKNLVEFKAGKMTLKETMVYPDKRKGLVYIYQSDDSLMHFCWKDRSNGSIEDEPKTDKDDDNCRKVNEILNNPPALGSQRSGGATPDGDLQNMLSNMSQQQLMQLFGGVGQIGGLSSLLGTMNQSSRTSGSGSSSVPSSAPTPAAVTSAPPISSPAPAAAVAPATPATPADAAIPRPTRPAAPAIDLSSSVNPESLQAILNNPEFVRELSRHLPSQGDNTQEDLRSTLASPQFQQALSMFSTALQSGQLGPVVSQFEVGNEAVSAANQGNMEEFVRALQAATISSTASPQQSKTADEKEAKHEDKKLKKDDDDEDMNLD
ncbi:unnamed protein product [Nesidiocoris tenuis]|uniref:Uncharacterized protein n=1 Tax=Nesidiocoris tenuis TaxID=355587 RepID=A0A6H5HFB4_9HEMI|nr:unnamed protein product [Nesidiocoris tenuis]